MELKPIGIIHTPFKQSSGTPIQPAFAKGAEGIVELYPEYTPGLKDLDGFDRIWLIYFFDRSAGYKLTVTPYMDTSPRGLFATRAPARPNPIGLSSVKLRGIEANKLFVADVDMLDNTPLLDIKPYCPKFDCFEVNRTGWLANTPQDGRKSDDRFHK